MVRRWDLRHRIFKLGCKGILVSAVVFIAGFSAPAWRNDMGLWMTCERKCMLLSEAGIGYIAWFDAVRALECLALCAYIFSIAFEMYEDFISKNARSDSRVVELLAASAGILGLVGIIVYSAFTPVTSGSSSSLVYPTVYLNWGFGLVTAASVLAILFSMAIAYGRTKALQDLAAAAASVNVSAAALDPDIIAVMCSGMAGGPTGEGLPPTMHFTTMLQPPPYNLCTQGPGSVEQPPAYSELERTFKDQSSTPADVKPPPYLPPQPALPLPTLQEGTVVPVTEAPGLAPRPGPPPYHSSENRPAETSCSMRIHPAGFASNSRSDSSEGHRSLMQRGPVYYIMKQGQLIPVYLDSESDDPGNQAPH